MDAEWGPMRASNQNTGIELIAERRWCDEAVRWRQQQPSGTTNLISSIVVNRGKHGFDEGLSRQPSVKSMNVGRARQSFTGRWCKTNFELDMQSFGGLAGFWLVFACTRDSLVVVQFWLWPYVARINGATQEWNWVDKWCKVKREQGRRRRRWGVETRRTEKGKRRNRLVRRTDT